MPHFNQHRNLFSSPHVASTCQPRKLQHSVERSSASRWDTLTVLNENKRQVKILISFPEAGGRLDQSAPGQDRIGSGQEARQIHIIGARGDQWPQSLITKAHPGGRHDMRDVG
jgi:hypothetical protein